MEEDNRWLNNLTEAILDGTPAALDSAGADASESQRAAIRQARILARIAELHRSLPADADSSASTPIDDTTGQLTSWGRLTIIEQIGRGAFGAVYRAKDPRLDREVALKLLRARAGADSDRLAASVIEEGRLLARVHHPNVVTIYDADRIAGRVGLTMEFVRGRTLEQALQERGPFSPAEVVAIGIDVCRALAAVHQAGLLHRDIKAQNVMRQDDGRLVLMDFGAGRELDEESGVAADMAGTPLYLAPEIFDGQPATVQSDVYSLGVLLYHLLTGGYPVTGRTIRDVREGHRRNRHVSLRDAGADVQNALAHAIDRALETNAADRYAGADEMAAALAILDAPAPVAVPWRWLAAGVALLAAAVVARALVGPNTRQAGGDSPAAASRPGGFAAQSTVNIRRLEVPNLINSGQLSQDGKYLPFSDSYDDGPLKLLEVATGKTRLLANDPGRKDIVIFSSVVSPDNSEVAYPWESGNCHCTELRIVDTQAVGNPPRVLLRAESVGWMTLVDWSRDRTEILALLGAKDYTYQIALVSTHDGSVRVLKAGLQYFVSMHLSPDSRYVVYDYPVAAYNDARDIFVLAADGSGEEFPLVEARSQDVYPNWTPDGRGVVFASDRSGTLGLWLAPVLDGRPEGAPQLLKKDMGRIQPLSLTRDGTLFYQLQSGAVDVYTARFSADGTIAADSVVQAAGSFLGSNMDPDWSPDGRSLAYVSRRRTIGPRAQALVVRSLDTGEERELWPDLGGFIEPRWSPDGRSFLVRGDDRRGVSGAWRLDARTGAILSSFGWVMCMEWAPDGRAFFSVPVESGRKTVQRTEVPSGRTREIYRDPAGGAIFGVAVSPDGQSLTVSVGDAEGTRLLVVPASGGPAREVMRNPSQFRFLQQWTRDGASILFTRRIEKPTVAEELWSVPAAEGTPRRLNLLRDRIEHVRVSPDGARIVFRTGRPFWDLWLMDNVLHAEPADGR